MQLHNYAFTSNLLYYDQINISILTGAKSVTKAIKKVASGPQRDEGTKWFHELSDKGLPLVYLILLIPIPKCWPKINNLHLSRFIWTVEFTL